MVYRVYVEKKPPFAAEAKDMTEQLRTLYHLTGVEKVRVINRYDVEEIAPELLETAKRTVFSEPQLDDVSEELNTDGAALVFAVEYLPGQFDQRADSAAQCIQFISGGERPLVATAKVYAVYGRLEEKDAETIQSSVINPVESRLAAMDRPETLKAVHPEPAPVKVLEGFTQLDREELKGFLEDYGLAMDLDDLEFLQGYFRQEGRQPTITEVRVVDTYWSDHCRHTTFSTHLDRIDIDDPEIQGAYERYLAAREEVYGAEKAARRPQTLMDLATIGTKTLKKRGLLPELDESEEINACSIHVPAVVDGEKQDWLLMFKNETHNHPTEIEPFGGAATCIGGCIRDPLSGRVYVHQAMRVTGGGDPRVPIEETLKGKLPQRKLARTAAAGLLLLRQPDRPGHRPCGRTVPPRLCGQAPGVRRGGGRGPRVQCPPGAARPRGCGHPAGRPHRPRRHRRGHRLLQEPQFEIPGPPWPARCRRATPPRSGRSSACSAAVRSPG